MNIAKTDETHITYLYLGKGIPFTGEAVHIGKVRVVNVSTT